MSTASTRERVFGTDGIRGRFGEGWMRPESISALGRAIGEVVPALAKGQVRRALLGHDGRRSGPTLEHALARGLAASGYEVESAGLITTPAIAHLTRHGDYALGAMISASHNPARDNGIKVFGSAGDKLTDELELRVEKRFFAQPDAVEEGAKATASSSHEDRYLAHLLRLAGDLKLDGMLCVLDCANGGGSRVAPRTLGRLGAQVVAISSEPDGDNINQGCGSTHPEALSEEVRLHSADIGIALDGDGDRCLLVDEHGGLVDGDAILTLCARHAIESKRWKKRRIVATVMSNRGLHRALREVGVEVVSVSVGDRQVVEALRRENLPLGGEQSGHIIFGAQNDYIGDGILTALHVLQVMRTSGVPLSELAAPFAAFPQVLINVAVKTKPALGEMNAVAVKVREIEKELGQDGRVLLRYSGTEPLARIMVEGPDDRWIRAQAQVLAGLITREIGG